MAAEPLLKHSLRERAVRVIRLHIVEANLPPGSSLPTERDLSRGLAVSRSVIREALATLEAEGIVERRPSAGYFVTEAGATVPGESLGEPRQSARALLAEAAELRLSFELGAAFVIVPKLSDAQLDELEAKAQVLDAAMDHHQAHAEAELDFHLTLLGFSQNQTLVRMGKQVYGEYFRALALVRPESFVHPTEDADAARHLPTVAALRTRDIGVVQAALRAHCRLPYRLLSDT